MKVNVTIGEKGADGADGTPGSIGIVGPKGADGKNAYADLTVKDGANGLVTAKALPASFTPMKTAMNTKSPPSMTV